MNWIIRKSDKILYHNHLNEVLHPVLEDVKDFNWILADIEHGSCQTKLPIDMDEDHFILTSNEFELILKSDVQIYWGVVLGVPCSFDINFNENEIPFTEGNGLIWSNGNIQYRDAEIEINCVDSGYTIVKFKNQLLSDKFQVYFPEAIELEKFK
jgi:hypothetical protein